MTKKNVNAKSKNVLKVCYIVSPNLMFIFFSTRCRHCLEHHNFVSPQKSSSRKLDATVNNNTPGTSTSVRKKFSKVKEIMTEKKKR